MAKFRKKPVVVEAVQWDGRTSEWHRIMKELDGTEHNMPGRIHTLEGALLASYDDWIIKGIKGELYPCKPDIFEATYEAVE